MNAEKFSRAAVVALLGLLIWQGAAVLTDSTLILPTPFETARALAALLGTKSFYIALAATLCRVFLGVLFSVSAGVLLGLVSGFWMPARIVLDPLVSMFRCVPVASIIILLNLWLKASFVPAAVCFLVCFPVAWTNTVTGVDATDRDLIEMAQVYRVPFLVRLRDLYLPQLRPYFRAALYSAVGMGWKSTVTAEVLAAALPSAGMNLYYSKIYLKTPELFAWTAAIVVCSMLIEALIGKRLGDKKWTP